MVRGVWLQSAQTLVLNQRICALLGQWWLHFSSMELSEGPSSIFFYSLRCRQVLLTYQEEPKQPRRHIAGLPLLELSPALESWSNIYTGPLALSFRTGADWDKISGREISHSSRPSPSHTPTTNSETWTTLLAYLYYHHIKRSKSLVGPSKIIKGLFWTVPSLPFSPITLSLPFLCRSLLYQQVY